MPAETHSHRGPVDRDEVERIVREQLAEILEVDPDAVTPGRAPARRPRRRRLRAASSSSKPSRASSASAWSGSRSTTTTSSSGDTVRDAIECVAAGLDAPSGAVVTAPRSRPDRRRDGRRGGPTGSTRSRPRSACASPTVRCCSARSRTGRGARSTAVAVERAARVPRRLRARSRRDALRVRALSRTFPRASSRRCAPASSNARVLAEVAAEIDLGAAPAARQGRGRGRRAREAVDPRRRVRGGRRRGLPRQRPRRPRATSCCAACASASPRPPPGPAAATTRPASRSSRPRSRSGGPATSCATRAPITRSTSSRPCTSATSASARAKADRRSKPSRRPRGSRGRACRTRLTGERGDGDAGAT